MSTDKEKMLEIIRSQPHDASYEELMRELAFERMVDRGLKDAREGRILSDEEVKQRPRSMKQMRGFLKGIDTAVPRGEDRS